MTDGLWLGVTNKTTSDKLAPVPLGLPQFLLPDSPSWTNNNTVNTVEAGILVQPGSTGLFQSSDVRLDVPSTSAAYNYVVYLEDRTDPDPAAWTTEILGRFVGSDFGATGWNSLPLGGGAFIPPNSTQLLAVLSWNQSGTSTDNWSQIYEDASSVPPLNGGVNHDGTYSTFRWSHQDYLGADIESTIGNMSVGSDVFIVEAGQANRNITVEITDGPFNIVSGINGYSTASTVLTDSGNNVPRAGQLVDLTATNASLNSVTYNSLSAYWGTRDDSLIQGYLKIGGGSESISDDAYGIDFQVREYIGSADWDLMCRASLA